MSKRASPFVIAGPAVKKAARRPIDKELKCILKAAVDGTQVVTTLKTTTFPCTIVGLRWSLSFAQDAGGGQGQMYWAIVVVPDGVSASTMAFSDAADFYTPEQHVLAFGTFLDNIAAVSTPKTVDGSTKTMRKMKGGDLLQFIAVGEATNTTAINGVVQFFCKS